MILEDRNKLEQQIRDLADISYSKYTDLKDIGVLGGQSGVAIFQFYCAKYFDDDTYAQNLSLIHI